MAEGQPSRAVVRALALTLLQLAINEKQSVRLVARSADCFWDSQGRVEVGSKRYLGRWSRDPSKDGFLFPCLAFRSRLALSEEFIQIGSRPESAWRVAVADIVSVQVPSKVIRL